MARRNFCAIALPCLLAGMAVISAPSRGATTIRVPADQSSIQKAIDAAAPGDRILVSLGVYAENLNFNGKNITITSVSGPNATIIDGSAADTVVTFTNGETRSAVLQGFTIRNGGSQFSAGGIEIANASPTIRNNIVISNISCSGTAGIYIGGNAAPLIQDNVVSDNLIVGCSGFINGGITVQSISGTEIVGNLVSGNTGGIQLLGAGNVTLQQNAVVGNLGAGINIYGSASDGIALIQNLVAGNRGPGIVWDNIPPSRVINNTVANNSLGFPGPAGASELSAGLINSAVDIENNLFVATGNYSAVSCNLDITNPLSFNSNDAFATNATTYAAGCPDQTGKTGNLSTDPLFVSLLTGNYLLQAGSPVIARGKASAPGLPTVDMVGNSRLTAGKVDMGSYEYHAKNVLLLSAYDLQFGSQPEGVKSVTKTITLTNQGSLPVAINFVEAGPSFSQTNDCGRTLAAAAICHIKIAFLPAIPNFQSDALGISTDATQNPQVVTLSGTGLAPGASLDLYAFSFPLQIIATSSSPQIFTLTNTGQAPLKISSIGSPGVGFSQTNNCPIAPATLAISASCTVAVVCTPAQTGYFTGNILINDNAPGSPQQIFLQGTGISAGIATVSTTSLTFPVTDIGKSSAPQSITLTNTGTGPLGISQIAQFGDFPTTNNCPPSLLAGGSCVISVVFTPQNNSMESAQINIVDDGQPGFVNVSVTGTGQAVTPVLTSLSVTNAPVGMQNLSFLITGTGFFFGSQVLWDQTPVYSGQLGPTQLSVSVPDNLLTVSGTPKITVVNPGPGGGTSNALTFTIYKPLNYNFASATYNYVTITGTNLNLSPFSASIVSSPFPLLVGGGSFTDMVVSGMGNISFIGGVSFENSIPGPVSFPVIAPFWDFLNPFGTDANNNVFWQVVGTAPNRKLVVEWRNVPYWGAQDTTSTVKFEVVFTEGSSNLIFNYADTVFGGANSADDNGATASVGVQVGTALGTQYSLNTPALKSKSSILWYPSDPVAQITASALDFGYHQIGNSSLRQNLTLTNRSIAALLIDSIAVSNSNFTQTNNCGVTLLTGKSCVIAVNFTPSQLGAQTAQLTVNGNEKDAPLSVTLNGIGTVDPTEVFPTQINFGVHAVGTGTTQSVTLANGTNQKLTVQNISTSSSSFTQTNNCGSSLTPGASCTIMVTFTPTKKGAVAGNVLMGLGGKPPVAEVHLSGAGQ